MKILIAEDDPLIREGLIDLLSGEGYHCIAAEDGNRAIAAYYREHPDCIVLDIMMPHQDGYSVCREIRRHNDNVAVIFLSAKTEEIDRVLGLELGADDYIMKPFGTREVVARIRAVTRRYLKNPSADVDSFTFGDLEIFVDELRAQGRDKTLELSLRDVKILQLLVENAGKVVNRDQLFNRAWGRDYMPSSRTLDQHISQLRKRIEPDPAHPRWIKTVHGVGYRYEPDYHI